MRPATLPRSDSWSPRCSGSRVTMVMVAGCRQWREAGVGERELGRSLLQGVGRKGSSKSCSGGGEEWGVGGHGSGAPRPGGWAPPCLPSAHLPCQPPRHSRSHLVPWLTTQVTHSTWGVSGPRRHTEASRWGWGAQGAPRGEGVSSIWRRQTGGTWTSLDQGREGDTEGPLSWHWSPPASSASNPGPWAWGSRIHWHCLTGRVKRPLGPWLSLGWVPKYISSIPWMSLPSPVPWQASCRPQRKDSTLKVADTAFLSSPDSYRGPLHPLPWATLATFHSLQFSHRALPSLPPGLRPFRYPPPKHHFLGNSCIGLMDPSLHPWGPHEPLLCSIPHSCHVLIRCLSFPLD